MRHTLVLLVLGLTTRSFLRGVLSDVERADNAAHFGVLCRIYNVAAHPPTSFPKPTELDKIIAEIDIIHASLRDDEWFKEVSTTTDKEKLRAEFKSQNAEMDKYWDRWVASVAKVSEGAEYKKLPGNTPSVKRAQKNLKKVEEEVEKIVGNLQKFNGEEEVRRVGDLFNKAIYGEPLPPDTEKPMAAASARNGACGATGLSSPGTGAGSSLVLDLHCLCASQDATASSGIKNACGVDVGGDSTVCWGGSLTDTGGKMWGELKTGCTNYPQSEASDTHAIRRLLNDFHSALAVGGPVGWPATDKRKSGLLGKSAAGGTNPGCDGLKGTSAGNGVCVYYGKPTNWKDIKWLQKMQEGLNILEKIRDHNATIRNTVNHLKILRHRAEEIYEEARTTLEVEKSVSMNPIQNQNQNPATSTDKASTQEPNPVNIATIPRSILPWTLLF